jgi:hypothetical protein
MNYLIVNKNIIEQDRGARVKIIKKDSSCNLDQGDRGMEDLDQGEEHGVVLNLLQQGKRLI